jgi:hypothetical protein
MFKRRSQSDHVDEKGEATAVGSGSQEKISEEEVENNTFTAGEAF